MMGQYLPLSERVEPAGSPDALTGCGSVYVAFNKVGAGLPSYMGAMVNDTLVRASDAAPSARLNTALWLLKEVTNFMSILDCVRRPTPRRLTIARTMRTIATAFPFSLVAGINSVRDSFFIAFHHSSFVLLFLDSASWAPMMQNPGTRGHTILPGKRSIFNRH
jgi:hypothetical protein